VAVRVAVEEGATAQRVSRIPMAHLSIELGHLYQEDFVAGPERIAEMARAVAPWANAARESAGQRLPSGRPRVSTCFLIDDYFGSFGRPQTVIPMIVAAYQEAGLPIDYIAREAACARSGDVSVATLVLNHLVPDPPPDTDGSRPSVFDCGWLANGIRSPNTNGFMAMEATTWQPPREHAANRHSVFIDVQLWDDQTGERVWSCPYLAAVWQLLRLGAVRFQGRGVVEPVAWSTSLPDAWDELPAVVRVSPRPDPFAAYETFSVLEGRFLPVEHAVRAILSQFAAEDEVDEEIIRRSRAEKLTLPTRMVDRVGYAFVCPTAPGSTPDGATRPAARRASPPSRAPRSARSPG
jgi:hypothetical protein